MALRDEDKYKENVALPGGISPDEITYAGRWYRPEQGGYQESIHYGGALPDMPGGTMMEHPNMKAVLAAKQYGMDSPQYQAAAYTAMKDRALRQLGTNPGEAVNWMNKLIEGGKERDIATIQAGGSEAHGAKAAGIISKGETERQAAEIKSLLETLGLGGKGKVDITKAGRQGGEDFDGKKPPVVTGETPAAAQTPALPETAPPAQRTPTGALELSEEIRNEGLPITRFLQKVREKKRLFDERDAARR